MKKVFYVFLALLFIPVAEADAVSTSRILELVNAERAEAGLEALQFNSKLNQAAQIKASDMVAKNYFDHNSPDGTTPWDLYDRVGYAWSSAGENLAVNSLSYSERAIVDGWMNSPGHRAIILDSRHTETGIGIAAGEYQGLEAIYISQLFGSPRQAPQQVFVPVPVVEGPARVLMPMPTVSVRESVQTVTNVAKKAAEVVVPNAEAYAEERRPEEVVSSSTIVVSDIETSSTLRATKDPVIVKASWFTRIKIFLSRLFSFEA